MDHSEGPRRLRLFVGYRLPDEVVERVVAWQGEVLSGHGVRPTPPECLHVTLVFLGSQPEAAVANIADTVRRRTAAARRPSFQPWRYRETPRVGMLTLTELALPGDAYAAQAQMLAGGLMLDFQAAGIYEPEKRDWKPHVTVARFREAPRLKPSLPALGPFSPVDVALYESKQSPSGSTYRVLSSVSFPK
jgi:RNA 2',3'-cyclic 3'-phosphodiesterase